jgi:hypothetical protein
MMQECERALGNLLRYCRSESWAGYDPYDALNSPLIRALHLNHRLPRTLFTQLLKRSPVNLRPMFGIKKGLNPKGLALALRAVILLAGRFNQSLPQDLSQADAHQAVGAADEAAALASDFHFLMTSLESVRSEAVDEAAWGYNFDWQSRAFFAPRGTPNVVCTTFAAHAYLDWHEHTGSRAGLDTAVRSCRFLLDRLNRTEAPGGFCFSYTPLDNARVHNVNLLVAELLARVFRHTGEGEYREAAERAVEYTVGRQRADGSWPYGEAPSQGWIDNFHTGFMLVSLKHIGEYFNTERWRESLSRGYDFYTERFFLADSTPRYYHDSLYPIDAHSSAQAVITFVEMTDLMPAAKEKRKSSVEWAIRNLQAPEGFFYFQRSRFYTNKIPYMRWAQSWMLYALSLHFCRSEEGAHG